MPNNVWTALLRVPACTPADTDDDGDLGLILEVEVALGLAGRPGPGGIDGFFRPFNKRPRLLNVNF